VEEDQSHEGDTAGHSTNRLSAYMARATGMRSTPLSSLSDTFEELIKENREAKDRIRRARGVVWTTQRGRLINQTLVSAERMVDDMKRANAGRGGLRITSGGRGNTTTARAEGNASRSNKTSSRAPPTDRDWIRAVSRILKDREESGSGDRPCPAKTGTAVGPLEVARGVAVAVSEPLDRGSRSMAGARPGPSPEK
jgi:hypothetical protein